MINRLHEARALAADGYNLEQAALELGMKYMTLATWAARYGLRFVRKGAVNPVPQPQPELPEFTLDTPKPYSPRDEKIRADREAGCTLQDIASRHGVTRERVRQITRDIPRPSRMTGRPVRPCAQCGKAFKARQSADKYCSPACGHASMRKYPEVLHTECACCRKPIQITAQQQIYRTRNVKDGLVKYAHGDWHCSRKCATTNGLRRKEAQQ